MGDRGHGLGLTLKTHLANVSGSPSPSTSKRSLGSPSVGPIDLDALQIRHGQLEAEQKAATEANQWTVKQNKQTLQLLNQENRELKAKMSKRGSVPTAREPSKTNADRAVEKLEKEVHELRRQHDRILQEKKTAVSKLENLQDAIRDMAACRAAAGAAGPQGPAGRQIRSLENRLDKALMKCNEAQSIRGTYDLVLDKMRREKQVLEARMRGVEQALKSASGPELEAAVLAHKEASRLRDEAKAELAHMSETLARDRARREAHVTEGRAKAKIVEETNNNLLAYQYKATPVAPTAPAAVAAATSADATASGTTADSAVHSSAQGDPSSCPSPSSTTPTTTLDAPGLVLQLCEALSCKDAGEALGRLLPLQQQRTELLGMQEAAEASVRETAGTLALTKSSLEEMRTGGKLSTQSQLDVVQAELKEAESVAASEAAALEALQRQYADVRGGLEHLGAMVAGLPLAPGAMPGPPPPVTDDTLEDVIAQIDERLMGASRLINTLPKAAALLKGLQDNPNLNFTTIAARASAMSDS